MPKTIKKKINDKYFQLIPEPKEAKAEPITQDYVMEMLRQKMELKEKREAEVKKAQEIRQAIYNLSMEINALEDKVDKFVMETYKNK